MKSIKKGAFSRCYNLKKINFPDTLTSIGYGAFTSCESLTEINLPDSIETIEDCAFIYCYNLKSIELPKSLQAVGETAFRDCSSLENVSIGKNVSKIAYGAFAYCYSLSSVSMEKGIKSIDKRAFKECNNLNVVKFSGTKADFKKIKINKDGNESLKNAAIHCTDSVINGKHIYETVVTNATKTQNGTISNVCEVCGAVDKTITVKDVKNIKLTAYKKAFKVKWDKVKDASGYEIQYSTSKSFKSAKTVTVKKAKTTSKTIKKLKAGKTYYVRIRAVKKVKGGAPVTSKWSKAKSIKIK